MNQSFFISHQKNICFLLLTIALTGFIFFFDPAGARVGEVYRVLLTDSSKISHINTWVKLLTGTFGILGLLAGLLARNTYLRLILWILFTIATFINGASQFLLGEEFNIHHYETAILEGQGFAGDFLVSIQENLLGFSLKFFGVFLVTFYLFLALRKHSFIPSLWMFLFGILVCGVHIIRTKGVELVGPSAFTLPEMILYKHTLSPYSGPRDEVRATPTKEAEADVIILVIDESIRGDYLSINRKEMGTTPYLEEANLINFGIAFSGGNCSRQSNIMLRVGLRPQDIPDQKDQIMRRPTLFDYARKAGLKTAYATNQIKKGYQNYMNDHEARSIHSYQILEGCSEGGLCGDAEIVHFIKEKVSSQKKIFIVVNKNGAHFPYAERLSTQNVIFNPSYKKGEAHSEREKIINTYKSAIHWTVDAFFKNLMPALEGKKYVLVYTSDHGEYVEVAKNGIGHGSTFTLPKEEAMVPLFVMTNVKEISQRLEKVQQVKFNKTTHFDIFPTLIALMGYDPHWVHQTFGPCLWDAESHPQKTYTGSIFHYGTWHSHPSS